MNTKKIFVGGGTGVVIALFLFANISIVSAEVGSVTNLDGTLTISPTTHHVVASLSLGHANTWTGQQTFSTSAPIFSTMTQGSVLFAGASGLLSQDNSNLFWDLTNHRLGIGSTTPASKLDVVATQLINQQGVYTPAGGTTITYGHDQGTQRFNWENYNLDKPILTLRTPNGLIGPASGISTALLIEGEPWFRGQSTGIAIEMGRQGYSSRIVDYGDNANSNGSRLQLQTHAASTATWNPGIKLYENGAVTVGNGSDPVDAPALALFSLWATATNQMTKPFEIIGTDGTSSLFSVTNSGKVGIGTTTPGASLDVNGNSIILEQSSTPSSSNAVCTTGTVQWDSGFIYVCVSNNTWKRATLAPF